jgi:hypothetical protein
MHSKQQRSLAVEEENEQLVGRIWKEVVVPYLKELTTSI